MNSFAPNGASPSKVVGFLTNRRLSVILALLLLVSAGLISWLLVSMKDVRNEARSRFFEQYNLQQLLLAQQAARTVEELFETFHHDLNLVTGLLGSGPVNSQSVKDAEPVLIKIFNSLTNTPMIDMAIFDVNGVVIGSYPPAPETIGVNLGWRDYFIWAKEEGVPNQIHLASFRTMTAGRAKGNKALIVCEGIYGENREFKGLAIFTLNFDELAKKYILPVRIGKNGYAWLVDAKNRMTLVDPKNRVTDRSFEASFLPKWPRLYSLLMNADLERPETGWYDYEDPVDSSRTIKKLVGYSPVRIGDQRWILGVATPDYEIEDLLATFIKRQENFSVSVVVSILVGALVACGLLFGWNSMLSMRVLARTRDLEAARAELVAAEKLAAVGHLALGLTHEIRNPLSAIRMNVQMIREEAPENELLQENFTIIEEEILRLNRLLGDVMGFAKPRPLMVSRTDLKALVERVGVLLNRQLAEKGIRLETAFEGQVTLFCDPEQIQQVLLNLLLNSMDALEERDEDKLIRIEAGRAADNVILRVIDNGAGISEEMKAKVFDPFFTTKAAGGGLGLATLQSIVLRHGGSVEVAGEVGKGAVFTVTLPVQGPQPSEGER